MKNIKVSDELSPLEIKNKEFKKTMLGYSPEEVIGFLDGVAKLWEKVQKNERELIHRIERLEQTIQAWQARESDLEKIREEVLKQAAEQAKQLLADSEQRAQVIREGTETWLAEVLQEVEEVERRKNNFITAFRSALDSHYEILKMDQTNQEPIAVKLSSFLKTSKKPVESKFLS